MKRPRLSMPFYPARALAELAIIVVGVLIAQAAQSWWENRGEARERAAAVEATRRDVDAFSERNHGLRFGLFPVGAPLPAWDDLVHSGRTDLIPDDTRWLLADIENELEKTRAGFDLLNDLQNSELQPLMLELLNIEEIFGEGRQPDVLGLQEFPGCSPVRLPSGSAQAPGRAHMRTSLRT